MAILERARNYKEVYYCTPSVIGDHVLEFLLEELRKRSLVYDELCKKDANREMSDGY